MVKEGFKLDAEQMTFSTHASLALDAVVKVSLCLFSCDDDGAVSVLKAEMRFVIAVYISWLLCLKTTQKYDDMYER